MKVSNLISVLLCMSAILPVILGQCVANQGVVSTSDSTVCSCCYSGYAGNICNQTVGSTCLLNAPVASAYYTASSPSLDSVAYVLDQLQISVSSPVVRGRECGSNGTTLKLGLTSTDSACTSFTKAISSTDCTDIWSTSVIWSDCISKCGFVEYATDSSSVTYIGYVLVNNVDVVDQSGDIRTQRSTFPITVQFPTTLSATIENIEVIAEFSLQGILSSQSFNPLNNLASLLFMTTVPWPYVISSSSILLPSTYTLTAFDENSNGEVCDANSGSCIQYWILTETPNNGVCTLAGNYTITLTPACRSGAGSDCPYVGGETIQNAFIYAEIQSESFCASLQADIVVTPSLDAVLSPGSSVTKTTFMQDHLAYFMFEAASTQAQISTLVLTEVTISNLVDPLYLAGPTALGASLLFQKNNADTAAYQLPFQFNLNATIFDSESTFTVTASVDIFFSENSKRSITFQRTIGQTSMNQTVVITTEKNTDTNTTSGGSTEHVNTSSASQLASASFSVVILLLLFLQN